MSELEEGEFTIKIEDKDYLQKEIHIGNYSKIPRHMKTYFIIPLFSALIVLFFVTFLSIEVILNHIRLSEGSILNIFVFVEIIAFLLFFGVDYLREGLNKYQLLKKYVVLDSILIKQKMTDIDDEFMNRLSSKHNKKRNIFDQILIGLMIILLIALYISIGKTEEGYWYLTDMSRIISGFFFILILIIYYVEVKNEKRQLLAKFMLLKEIIYFREEGTEK